MLTHSYNKSEVVDLIRYPSEAAVSVRLKGLPESVVPISLYNLHFGVEMRHGISCDAKDEKTIRAVLNKIPASFHGSLAANSEELQAFLKCPKNYFTVTYVNSICGYGLVANQDIPAKTVVGIYSGKLILRAENVVDTASLNEKAYDMSLEVDGIEHDGCRYSLSIRANYYSDLTRFASHFPTQFELNRLDLGKDIQRSQVLTANMDYLTAICDGVPVKYFKTTEAIKKGRIAAISYGSSYWKRRGSPCLFVQDDKQTLRVALHQSDAKCYQLQAEPLFGEPVKSKVAITGAPVASGSVPKPIAQQKKVIPVPVKGGNSSRVVGLFPPVPRTQAAPAVASGSAKPSVKPGFWHASTPGRRGAINSLHFARYLVARSALRTVSQQPVAGDVLPLRFK